MVTVLAGQNYDLQDSPENIVRYFIRDRWNLVRVGYVPARNEILFSSFFGWAGRKSYQIVAEPSGSPLVTQLNIGVDQWMRYNDPIFIHVFMIKNRDEIPPQMHFVTQKVEQIVLANVNNVGYGLNSIRLTTPFSAVDSMTTLTGTYPNQTEISLWHSRATVELLYFRVTTGTLTGVRTTKRHKYNVEVE